MLKTAHPLQLHNLFQPFNNRQSDIIAGMDNIYREEILEHYRDPLNFGKLDQCSVASKQTNPLCGDEIEMFVEFDASGKKIQEITFTGQGCAICVASTSMLTEFAKNKTKSQLTKFSEQDMLKLLGIEVSESRKKCALLGLAVLNDCLV